LRAALRPWAAERGADDEPRAETIRAATAALSGAERLRQRVTPRRARTAGAEQVPAAAAVAAATPAQRRPLAEALPLAPKVRADRDDPDGPDHLGRVHDPAARHAQPGA
jgi:hypothetical protein